MMLLEYGFLVTVMIYYTASRSESSTVPIHLRRHSSFRASVQVPSTLESSNKRTDSPPHLTETQA